METGKNRFFNICEAYQSMLGKSNRTESAQRRYASRGGCIDESYDDFDNADYGNDYQGGVNLTEEEFDRLVSFIRDDIRSDFDSIKLLDDGTYYRMAWEHLNSMNIPTPKYGDVSDIVLIYSYEKDEDENGEPIYVSDKITIKELVDAIYNKYM